MRIIKKLVKRILLSFVIAFLLALGLDGIEFTMQHMWLVVAVAVFICHTFDLVERYMFNKKGNQPGEKG